MQNQHAQDMRDVVIEEAECLKLVSDYQFVKEDCGARNQQKRKFYKLER